MSDASTTFRRCVERVCAAVGTDFRRFATAVGLHEFLLDSLDVTRTPKDVAVRALDELCIGDRKLDDQIVCLSVIQYLDRMLGAPHGDPIRRQRLEDLAGLVSNSVAPRELERWVESWYE